MPKKQGDKDKKPKSPKRRSKRIKNKNENYKINKSDDSDNSSDSEWTPDMEFEEEPEEEMDTLELQKFIQKIFPSKSGKQRLKQLEKIDKLKSKKEVKNNKKKIKKTKKSKKEEVKKEESDEESLPELESDSDDEDEYDEDEYDEDDLYMDDDDMDRGAVCLLSGGLDSSLIASLVAKYLDTHDGEKLHTWSIGLNGSEDLKKARIVAEHIGSIHHEVMLTESDFLNAIPEVIEAIESNDTTTVRASVGNWLISKHIKEKSDDKIVFNGDGSDEVAGGYLYFHCAPNPIEFDLECKRLLKDIHLFDVLRSDRSISSHGLEARTPFLDKNFVDSYLSIPQFLRDHKYNNECEKYLIRNAFKDLGLLPNEILFRTKEAFSDGVSTETKSWFEIIQDYAVTETGEEDKKKAEQLYYDNIFNRLYGTSANRKVNTEFIMPYKWMPKFIEATDASARTLDVYRKVNNSN
tara:strand:- start:1691 stop:3082 length:1392 start_codon:yes stop_codon:yes gene_type:complete